MNENYFSPDCSASAIQLLSCNLYFSNATLSRLATFISSRNILLRYASNIFLYACIFLYEDRVTMLNLCAFRPQRVLSQDRHLSLSGGATMRIARKKENLLFAAIPLLFGIQQIIEGVIWVTFGTIAVQHVMTILFLLFSHILWPTFMPLAVLCMEPVRWRRWVLIGFVFLGMLVSSYFLYFLFVETVEAQIRNMSIAYVSPHFSVYFLFSPYTVATCASCLFSTHKWVNFFGVMSFLSAVVAFHFYQQTFVSVWCFFAAILSGIIYLHFYTENRLGKK